MTDVSEILRKAISEILTEEESNISESTVDAISNVIAGDPRLLRLDPDSSKDIKATIELIDDITNLAQLSSFNVDDPNHVRKRIVADVESKLVGDPRQSPTDKSFQDTLCSGSAPKDSMRDTTNEIFTICNDEPRDDAILVSDTGAGKTYLITSLFKQIPIVDFDWPSFDWPSIDWAITALDGWPALPRIQSPTHFENNATISHRAEAKDCPVTPISRSAKLSVHSQYIHQYLNEFRNHKANFETYLNRAKQSDDLIGAMIFRKAINERLEAERDAWMLFAHRQAIDLKSLYSKMEYLRDQDHRSPYDNRIELESTGDITHLTIDTTQFTPEQQDKFDISFSDTCSFEWTAIEETLSLVWDCFDEESFQFTRDTIIDKTEFPIITPSDEFNHDFMKSLADISIFDLESDGQQRNGSYHTLRINTESPNFLVANGQPAFCGTEGLNKYGVHQPPDSLDIFALYPEENIRKGRRFIDDLVGKLDKFGAEPTSLKQESISLEKVTGYTKLRQTCSDLDCVVAVLPDKDLVTQKDGFEDSYSELKKQLIQQKIPLQIVKYSSLGEEACLENIAAEIVAKAGGIPWRVDKIPGDVDAFAGLNVTHKSESGQHLGASANIILPDGLMLASKSVTLRQDKGFKANDITRMLKELIQVYVKEKGHQPNRIVIHGDGKYYVDHNVIVECLEEAGDIIPEFDLVEIRKSSNMRMIEVTEDSFNAPEKGAGFVSLNGNHAYITTTGRPQFKPWNSFGTSRPIHVVKRHGPTDIETLAQQVFWLSKAHVTSINESTRLPITMYYAARCAEHVLKGHSPNDELIRGIPYV